MTVNMFDTAEADDVNANAAGGSSAPSEGDLSPAVSVAMRLVLTRS
jgi:hypothetical protein